MGMARRARWGALGVVLVAGAGAGAYLVWNRAAVPEGAPRVALSVDTAWHAQLGLTTSTYHTALVRAGAEVNEVRPGDDTPESILAASDALVLAGGGDVDPARYGGGVPAIAVDPERDAFELALIEGALARDLPVLGVCRGLQILNVAHGGTLRSLREDPELGPAHGGELEGDHLHSVRLETGSRLRRLHRTPTLRVNSYHGQAIDRLGAGLTAVAHSEDGVIEAVEGEGGRFVVATQWHPEILSLRRAEDLRVFEALVAAARKRKGR